MSQPRSRSQLIALKNAPSDAKEAVLNDILQDLYQQLDDVRAVGGLTVLDWLAFDTGGTAFASAPLRVSCPYTPQGVLLLALEQTRPAGQPVLTNASDVKWHFASGAQGDGAIIIDYISGLATNSSYRVRLGVLRG